MPLARGQGTTMKKFDSMKADNMQKIVTVLFVLAALPLGIYGANAEQGLVKTVAKGCKTEIEQYCAKTDFPTVSKYITSFRTRLYD